MDIFAGLADNSREFMRKLVWLVSLLVFLHSCKNECSEGEGDRFEDRRNFSNFHTFQLDIPATVNIYPDTSYSESWIVVFGQENVTKKLAMGTGSGKIKVAFAECFENHEEIEFNIYSPTIRKLILNSSCRVNTKLGLQRDRFEVEVNSTASGKLVMNVDSLLISGNGSPDLVLEGYARGAGLEVGTLGNILAGNLITDTCVAQMKGTGSIVTYVTGLLDARVSGTGSIRFRGEDSLKVNETITGSGKVIDER